MLPENYQETIAAEIKKLYLGDKSKNKPCFKVQKYIPQAMSSSTLLFGDNHLVPVQVTTTEGKLRNFVVTIVNINWKCGKTSIGNMEKHQRFL